MTADGSPGRLLASVRAGLDGRSDDPSAAPLVRLAEHYAALMDLDPEDVRVAAELGPKLLAVLTALGVGGGARSRAKSTTVDAMPAEAVTKSDVPGRDELAELRAKRGGAR